MDDVEGPGRTRVLRIELKDVDESSGNSGDREEQPNAKSRSERGREGEGSAYILLAKAGSDHSNCIKFVIIEQLNNRQWSFLSRAFVKWVKHTLLLQLSKRIRSNYGFSIHFCPSTSAILKLSLESRISLERRGRVSELETPSIPTMSHPSIKAWPDGTSRSTRTTGCIIDGGARAE